MRRVTLRVSANLDLRLRGTSMRRTLQLICCSALLATFFVSQTFAQRAGGVKFAAEVPLLDCNGMPCIEARMATGPNLKMAIDTGNVDSVLDAAFANAAGLKATAPLPEGAPTGMFNTVIPSLSIGSVKLTNVRTL